MKKIHGKLEERKEQWDIALKIAKEKNISTRGRVIAIIRIVAPLIYEIKMEQLNKKLG